MKGNMVDIDGNYLLLPIIFQYDVENSQSQNDVRAIVNKRSVLNQILS